MFSLRSTVLDGHDLLLLGGVDLVAFGDVLVGDVLEFFLHLLHLVFGHRFILELLHFVHHLAAHVADVDLGVLHLGLGLLAELFAALFGERWDDDAQDVALMARCEAEVGVEDGLVDGAHDGLLPGLDDDGACVGGVDVGHLADFGHGAVVVDFDAVEHAGVGLAGADLGQLFLQEAQRALHAVFCLVEASFR